MGIISDTCFILEKYQIWLSGSTLFIVGFTQLAANTAPTDLVCQLNDIFSVFDALAERHGLEKIKTIGDGYMCAGGIPQPNHTNPGDTVAAGLAMMEFLKERRSRAMPENRHG